VKLAALLAGLGLAASIAHAQQSCRVIDDELRGTYHGGCRGGLAEGKGVAAGLARYEGEFRRGLKHGYGVKSWPWGDRYEGAFVDDRKHGRGVYTWGEGTKWAGERYEGEFVADQRNGWGLYTWPSGDRFEGAWLNDVRQGYSVMETRRAAAQKAQQAAYQPGVTVCWLSDNSLPDVGLIKGMVESLDGSMLTVRLAEVPPALSSAAASALAAGQVITDDAVSWSPCL
jgi:hypothetical protein